MDRTSVNGLRPCSAHACCADPSGRSSGSGGQQRPQGGTGIYCVFLRLQSSTALPKENKRLPRLPHIAWRRPRIRPRLRPFRQASPANLNGSPWRDAAPGACIWGNQVSFLIMFGGSSSQVDRRRDIDDTTTTTDAFSSSTSRSLLSRARGRSTTARSCLATKGECGNSCKTAPARHRGDAHHVQHTPSLTGAAGQLPPFVASGVLICLSRLGSPIFGRVVPGGGLQPSPFVLRISPTETTSDFLRQQQ